MLNGLINSRILIVDDASENVELLCEILKDYKRSVALNGEDALKIVLTNIKPDLILLDVIMPGMDGFEVCRRLKEKEETRDIPVIFITAKSEVKDETKGLELGAVDFIHKPISPPVVLARVRNQLELSKARKLLTLQNEKLAAKNKSITDSINYAKKIQTAMTTTKEMLTEIFPENFILYEPKDIISGDFFWTRKIDEIKVIAVVDCTGHGVPGALMSILGISALYDLVFVKKNLDPSVILQELDSRVISELNKDSQSNSVDGMDMGICAINIKERTLKYSGARRTLYYFANGEFNEIKGTRKSIGEVGKNKTFEQFTIKLTDDFIFYLTTDGYDDQNNSDNIRYGTKRVKEMLHLIYRKPLQEQFHAIHSEFIRHKGNEEQRDDITFMGIKL